MLLLLTPLCSLSGLSEDVAQPVLDSAVSRKLLNAKTIRVRLYPFSQLGILVWISKLRRRGTVTHCLLLLILRVMNLLFLTYYSNSITYARSYSRISHDVPIRSRTLARILVLFFYVFVDSFSFYDTPLFFSSVLPFISKLTKRADNECIGTTVPSL